MNDVQFINTFFLFASLLLFSFSFSPLFYLVLLFAWFFFHTTYFWILEQCEMSKQMNTYVNVFEVFFFSQWICASDERKIGQPNKCPHSLSMYWYIHSYVYICLCCYRKRHKVNGSIHEFNETERKTIFSRKSECFLFHLLW